MIKNLCLEVLLWLNYSDTKNMYLCSLLNIMQVRLIKELYGNQIRELYHSLPYHMIELVLDDSDWLVSCITLVFQNHFSSNFW